MDSKPGGDAGDGRAATGWQRRRPRLAGGQQKVSDRTGQGTETGLAVDFVVAKALIVIVGLLAALFAETGRQEFAGGKKIDCELNMDMRGGQQGRATTGGWWGGKCQ